MNEKGFLLVDSLICALICFSICILCASIWKIIDKDEDVFDSYVEQENEYYERLFSALEECEVCTADESDTESAGSVD